MDNEFASIWKAVGWTDFVNVSELGYRDLTIQFLCTLIEENDGISFRLFGNEFSLSWKELSMILSFYHRCNSNVVKATRGFEKQSFWQSISGESTYWKPRCNDIQNPTLCLMHKWLALTCLPRYDVPPIRIDELQILFTMVNKIKISPGNSMIKQWLQNFAMVGTIECTSLIT
jgi:hypothetical protein